ncbi:hypothetical protein HUJ04_000450 [Dendroctonus ponderosae]|nr:hypothetical protein HUJ04_000450 [Dendroctonus ponderosae]
MIDGQIANETTLNGCLTLNTPETYNSCMEEVRQNMIVYLTNEFDDKFRSTLQSDCEFFGPTNCIILEDTSSNKLTYFYKVADFPSHIRYMRLTCSVARPRASIAVA